MVTDTENTMRRLSKKIGIKFDNILTRPTILKRNIWEIHLLKNQINILEKYFIKKRNLIFQDCQMSIKVF